MKIISKVILIFTFRSGGAGGGDFFCFMGGNWLTGMIFTFRSGGAGGGDFRPRVTMCYIQISTNCY